MSYIYYHKFIFLPYNSTENLDKAQNLLNDFFSKLKLKPEFTITRYPLSLVLKLKKKEEYEFEIGFNNKGYVLKEAQEIAKNLSTDPKISPDLIKLISFSPARFEISGDIDPNMDFFNESLFLIEALTKIQDSIGYDVQSGTII
jgi:hypothetical protein